jgi:hypothetical protein
VELDGLPRSERLSRGESLGLPIQKSAERTRAQVDGERARPGSRAVLGRSDVDPAAMAADLEDVAADRDLTAALALDAGLTLAR